MRNKKEAHDHGDNARTSSATVLHLDTKFVRHVVVGRSNQSGKERENRRAASTSSTTAAAARVVLDVVCCVCFLLGQGAWRAGRRVRGDGQTSFSQRDGRRGAHRFIEDGRRERDRT